MQIKGAKVLPPEATHPSSIGMSHRKIKFSIKDAKYFSILDIHSGYHHVSIHPDSGLNTAFTCPYGQFLWKRLAFGVQTAPSIFFTFNVQIIFEIFR